MHKHYRTDSSVWDIRYDSLKGTAGAYKQRESDEKLDASVLWETASKRVTEFIKSHGRMTFVCVYVCTCEKASVCLHANSFMRVRKCLCSDSYGQNGGPGVDTRLSVNPSGLFYCSDVALCYSFKATKVVLQGPKAHYASFIHSFIMLDDFYLNHHW